jgi:plastocyanin
MSKYFLALSLSLLLISCNAREKVQEENGPLTSGYQVATVTNGGSIKGIVKATAPTTATSIEVQKDQDACGMSHPNPGAVLGSAGVSGAIVYLERVASGKAFAAAPEATLRQKGCEYLPHLQIIHRGAKIILTNEDAALHNSNFKLLGISELNPAQPKGAPPREVDLPKDGLYTVNCDVHAWMRGFIMVVDHPYYAITDKDGAYSLADIPPGTYTLKMWRDNWQVDQPKDALGHITTYSWGSDFQKQQSVTIAAGAAQTVDFTIP